MTHQRCKREMALGHIQRQWNWVSFVLLQSLWLLKPVFHPSQHLSDWYIKRSMFFARCSPATSIQEIPRPFWIFSNLASSAFALESFIWLIFIYRFGFKSINDTGCHSTDCKTTWREWIKWLQSPAQIQKNLPHTEINKQLFHKPALTTLIHPDKQGLQNTYPLKGSPNIRVQHLLLQIYLEEAPCWLQKLWVREPKSRSPLRYSDRSVRTWKSEQ